MQRKRPLLLWTLLTTALPTLAFDFMVDGLCYNRNSDGKSITVTYEKKRIFISLLLAVAGTLSLLAGNLSETEAAAVAARFMSGRTTTPFVAVTAPIARVATKSATVGRDYYTFNNASGAGWAIVSASGRVLGYSSDGTFTDEDMPEAMSEWLAATSRAQAATSQADNRGSIAPMITAMWDQGDPFNRACPIIGANRAQAGCTAIALAQLLYFYRPQVNLVKDIAASGSSPAVAACQFNWAAMKDVYSAGETGAAVDAMAKLVYACARVNGSTFGASATSGSILPASVISYFEMAPTMRRVARKLYSAREWDNLIYNELQAGRPVVYYGKQNGNVGHFFLCDGYDGNGYYHFNWGWSGKRNGYFTLELVNPYVPNQGSLLEKDGFVDGQEAIVGIAPTIPADMAYNLTLNAKLSCSTLSHSREGADVDFGTVKITAPVISYYGDDRQFELALGLYEGNRLITLGTPKAQSFSARYSSRVALEIAFGAGLADGAYILRPLCRLNGTDEWLPIEGSELNCAVANIDGNSLTIVLNDAYSGALKVNSVTLNGSLQAKRPLEVQANVTGLGVADYNTLFLWENGTLVTAQAVYLGKDESKDVFLHYKPTATGSKRLEISSDLYGENILYSTTANIVTSPAASFTGSLAVTNAGANNIVDDRVIRLRATLNNTGSTAYNDEVTVIICTTGDVVLGKKVNRCSIAPGESASYDIVVDNLDDGGKYYFGLRYMSAATWKQAASTRTYTMRFPAEVLEGDLNGDGNVNAGDVSELYSAILRGAGDTTYDLNGDGNVNAGDISSLYSIILGQ